MEIFQVTFKEYIVLMTQLKACIGEIINITPDMTRKLLAIAASEAIDNTIHTAQAEINLPSSELYDIAVKVKELFTCGNPPIPEVMELLNKGLEIIGQASDVLMKITDDTYLTNTIELVKE